MIVRDCPTRVLVPALKTHCPFQVVTKKRSYLFMWDEDEWSVIHQGFGADRSERLRWQSRCHDKVAWLTAFHCFAEGITSACTMNCFYEGYYDRTMAAGAIQKAWRRHCCRAKAPAVLAKARVLQELCLMPPGGPTGTIDTFAGGSVYKTLANKY
jgi:hypothetical protein